MKGDFERRRQVDGDRDNTVERKFVEAEIRMVGKVV
jgi:hypothetical protein